MIFSRERRVNNKADKKDVGKAFCTFANPSTESNHKSGLQPILWYTFPSCSVLSSSLYMCPTQGPSRRASASHSSKQHTAQDWQRLCAFASAYHCGSDLSLLLPKAKGRMMKELWSNAAHTIQSKSWGVRGRRWKWEISNNYQQSES